MRSLGRGDAYAAHTGGLNSYSVGVSFCGMWGAKPGGPFGPAPLLEDQVTAGLRFVGQLCTAWHLDPTNPEHLFTHAEAWTRHRVKGTRNDEKWDILVLPYLPEVPADRVGDLLRAEVYMLGVPWPAASIVTPPRPPTPIAT
jgi:alkanesulfonate monooxygenase SsuD/methylene tetrahydromethanopterin reductase-like flavin-dependent oxidoreductase (luciferase family)